jgi:hypothetical protein
VLGSPDTVFDRLEERLAEGLVDSGMSVLDHPHVVVCIYDPRVSPPTYLGPYPSAAEALEAARLEVQCLRRTLADLSVQVRIAPLFPPQRPLEAPLAVEP